MNRQQLAHILRAASRVVGDPDVLVLGSQSILGSYDEDELPPASTMSMEADIAFLDDPDRGKADLVEGAIGELSTFHSENGYYAEGVDVSTAILPIGWRDRVTTWSVSSSAPATPWFLEKHDLAVAKLMAGRPKDLEFVGSLLDLTKLSLRLLGERLADMEPSAHSVAIERARRWVDGRASRGPMTT